MVAWADLPSGIGKVGTWVAALAAVALFALPPSLAVAVELSVAVEPIAVLILAIFLVILPAFIVWISLRETPLDRVVLRRVALALCAAGAAGVGFLSLVEGLAEGQVCEDYGHSCLISDLPWTIPSAIALTACFGLLPLGLALLVGIPRIEPGKARPNLSMTLRTLAFLPAFVLGVFLVNEIAFVALVGYGGTTAVEPRTMALVVFLVPTALFTFAWPLGIALLPGSNARLSPLERNHLALAVVALAVPLAYFVFWNAITFGLRCYQCGALRASMAAWGGTLGAVASPLLAALLFLPLAYVLASAALAKLHSRRTSTVESILGEVRSLYANGRLKRSDYSRMASMSEGMLEDGEASSSEFRAMLLAWAAPFLLVGPLLATIIFATIGQEINEGRETDVLSWTANVVSLLVCVAAAVWMLLTGLGLLAVAREANQDQLAKIRALHESLIHVASEAPLLPRPAKGSFKRTP